MKKWILCTALVCALVFSTAAAAVPDNTVRENRDGRQLVAETYILPPGADPGSLIQEPFDLEGFHYTHLDTVKEEHPFEDRKPQAQTVTVETGSKNLADVLAALAPTLDYNDGVFTGTLALDHTTLRTEAAGYSSHSYAVTDTRTFTGLDRNDPSYIPKTTTKNGQTLTLESVSWTTTGSGLAGDTLVPTGFTATATYAGQGYSKSATGYVTTAEYTGEVVSQGVRDITYTVTYLGEPIPVPASHAPLIAAICTVAVLILAAGVLLLLHFRKNASIYRLTEDGREYELLGRQRVSRRKLAIDLTRLKQYPQGEAVIELRHRAAQKLFGRVLTVRLMEGTRTHRVEQCDGGNYWFKIAEEGIE